MPQMAQLTKVFHLVMSQKKLWYLNDILKVQGLNVHDLKVSNFFFFDIFPIFNNQLKSKKTRICCKKLHKLIKIINIILTFLEIIIF